MRCFPACFGHWRHKGTMEKVQDQCLSPCHELHESVKLLAAATESIKEDEIVNPMKLASESDGKCEEHINESNREKADNSNSYTDTDELTNDKLVESGVGKVEKERDKGKGDGKESKLSSGIPCSADHVEDDFLINSKDSCVAVKSKEITSECCPIQEESSESLFSLSIDSRKQVFASEMGEKEVSSPLTKTLSKYDEDKENMPLSKDPVIKQSFEDWKPSDDHHKLRKRHTEIAVDTSLSSWLAETEKSPQKMSIGNSPESEKNYGKGQVLGTINFLKEIKVLNEPSSAGSTPCSSADDQLGIGTVGRYWRQRGLVGQVVNMGTALVAGECQLFGLKDEHVECILHPNDGSVIDGMRLV